MKPTVFTSTPRDFTPKAIDILLAEHRKKAKGEVKFIEEMHWKSSVRKAYTEDLVAAIFWQAVPPKKPAGCTNWFGYYWARDLAAIIEGREPEPASLRIFGLPDFDPVVNAVLVHASESIIYSRYQHDFYYDPSGTVSVDGGREYMRIGYHKPTDYVQVKYDLMKQKYLLKGRWHGIAGYRIAGRDPNTIPDGSA